MSFITRERTEEMGNTFVWYYADSLRSGKDEIGTEHFLAALLSIDRQVTDQWWVDTGIPRDFFRIRFGVTVEDQVVDGREENTEKEAQVKKNKTVVTSSRVKEYSPAEELSFFPVSDALIRALDWEIYLSPLVEKQAFGYDHFIQSILLADERDEWQELLQIPQMAQRRRDLQGYINQRIIGLAAPNMYDWILDRKREAEGRGAVVLWWGKQPSSKISMRQGPAIKGASRKGSQPEAVNETLEALSREIEIKGYFEVFYIRDERLKFRAIIRDFCTDGNYDEVKEEWQSRYQGAEIPMELEAFEDGNNPRSRPRFLLLCSQIDVLEPDLPASAIRYPEGIGEVVQNNLQPVAAVQTHFPSESARLESFVNERVKGVIGVENQAEEVAGIIRTLDARKERGAMLGIFGRWGRGKTFLWQQLQGMLEPIKVRERRLRYEQPILELLAEQGNEVGRRKLQQEMEERRAILNRQKARYGGDEQDMQVVEFHAWKYQDTEAAWAYLYECMAGCYYAQPALRKALRPGPHEAEQEKDKFTHALWEKAKRYGRHLLFRRGVLRAYELPIPLLVWNGILRILRFFRLIVLYKQIKLNYVKNGVLPILGFIAFISLNGWLVYYLGTSQCTVPFDTTNIEEYFNDHRVFSILLSGLSLLVGLGGAVRFQKDVRAKALNLFKKYTASTSFDRLLGVQAEIQKELSVLLRAWIPDGKIGRRRILVFVDDLDRCREEKIVEIIDALKVMLEDEQISKRVVVLAAIDERVLMRAISGKYAAQIERDKNLSTEHERKLRINRLVREYIDKLFIGGINLGSLAEHEKKEIFEAFTLNRNVVRFQQAMNEEEMKAKDEMPLMQQTDNREVKVEPSVPLQEHRAVPGLVPVIKAGDNRFEIEEFEYEMLHPYLHIFVELTPRSIRIYYYRYLLARQLMSHRLREDPVFTQAWNSDFPHRELLPFLILKFTHDGEVDEIARLKNAIIHFYPPDEAHEEKICLFWVMTKVYGHGQNHPGQEPPPMDIPEKGYTPEQLCQEGASLPDPVWFGDLLVRPAERPMMCRRISPSLLITILEMVETVVPY